MLVCADLGLRYQALSALLDEIEACEAHMKTLIAEVDDVTANRGYAMSQSPVEADEVRRGFVSAGQDGSVTLRVDVGRIEAIDVLPWHGKVKIARERYLDHANAWLKWSDELIRLDFDGTTSAEINATFQLAGRALRDAMPPLIGSGPRRRVDAIFAD